MFTNFKYVGGTGLGLGRYIDSGSILRFSECTASPQESILSLDFNKTEFLSTHSNAHEEEHLCVRLSL